MNWLETYRDRVLTAEQAVLQIKSNTRLFLTGNCSVPQMVLAALTERAPALTNVEIVQVLTIGSADYVAPEMAGHLRVNTTFISDNVRRAVNEGRVTSGLAQADIAADAFAGTGVFKADGKAANLRAIAALFPETVHIVVMADSKIEAVKDLKGKRVSIDAAGSGTNAMARAVLGAYKLTEKRVKFAFENADRSLEMLQSGELDAFFFVGGAPLGVVEELAAAGKIRLIPLEGKEIDALVAKAPYMTKAEIPAGTYRNMPAVPSIEVRAIWLVNADVPNDLVFAIVRALFHPDNRGLLDSGHPKGKLIRLETARDGLPVPLHPGAEAYYASLDKPN